MKKNKKEIIDYINNLKGYEGYIQFSNRPIEDIFKTKTNIHVEEKGGFIYEAYFFNGTDSISIKQINDLWLVDEIKNISTSDTQTFIGINDIKVKMAQIWEEAEDALCENMKVKKLSKIVFAGFQGEKL